METSDERRGQGSFQADEDVVAGSELRRLEERVRGLERLLGRKTMRGGDSSKGLWFLHGKNRPCDRGMVVL
jgi:hypothetical protein